MDGDGASPNRLDPGTEDHPEGHVNVRAVLVRTVKNHQANGMTDRAASLTYFAMLSLFPAFLAAVSILSLVGEASLATDAAEYLVEQGADETTAATVRDTLEGLVETSSGAAGVALVLSFAVALNGASGAFAAAGRALNIVYAVEDERGFVRRKLQDIGLALLVIALLTVTIAAIFLGGGIADEILGETLGLGDEARTAFGYARWPVAIAFAMVAISIVYTYAPATRKKRWKWITPGAAGGVAIWILASAGFALYIQNFSSYGAAYGAFGAAIVLLLWLYVSANAFLLGAELNTTLERSRAAGYGGPPMVTPPPTSGQPEGPPPASPAGGIEADTSVHSR